MIFVLYKNQISATESLENSDSGRIFQRGPFHGDQSIRTKKNQIKITFKGRDLEMMD